MSVPYFSMEVTFCQEFVLEKLLNIVLLIVILFLKKLILTWNKKENKKNNIFEVFECFFSYFSETFIYYFILIDNNVLVTKIVLRINLFFGENLTKKSFFLN